MSVPLGTKNLQVFVIPIGAPRPDTNLAIRAASFDDRVPLLLESAAIFCLFVAMISVPATCCAMRAASLDVIEFWPVVFATPTV